ncbi:MAG: hypothetical protein AB1298_05315 [Bacteroidota bacterium]
MNHYIIDGNNLIGRIKFLQQIQKKNKQAAREGLVRLINKAPSISPKGGEKNAWSEY